VLFTLYTDNTTTEILGEVHRRRLGLVWRTPGWEVITRIVLCNLFYAGDGTLLAPSAAALLALLEIVDQTLIRWGLSLAYDKTEILHCTWGAAVELPVMSLGGCVLKVVEQFRLLGSTTHGSGHCTAAIGERTALARRAFFGLRHLWKDRSLPITLKAAIRRSTVLSVLTHGAETWTVLASDLAALDRFTYLSCRVVCGGSRWGGVSSETHRERCGIEPVQWFLRYARLRRLGHLLRRPHDWLPLQVVAGWPAAAGVHPRPGRAASWLRSVRDDLRQLGFRFAADLDDLRQPGTLPKLAVDASQRARWRKITRSPLEAAPLFDRQCSVCGNLHRTPAQLQKHQLKHAGKCAERQAERHLKKRQKSAKRSRQK
jgi:hypothetical protein